MTEWSDAGLKRLDECEEEILMDIIEGKEQVTVELGGKKIRDLRAAVFESAEFAVLDATTDLLEFRLAPDQQQRKVPAKPSRKPAETTNRALDGRSPEEAMVQPLNIFLLQQTYIRLGGSAPRPSNLTDVHHGRVS